jgi:Phospholipase_D-nuclease N-terminal
MNHPMMSLGWGWPVLVPIILLGLLVFAFEVWMLVDVIQNKNVPSNHKVWWIIGMFLVHPIVAIVYYFVSRSDYYKKAK